MRKVSARQNDNKPASGEQPFVGRSILIVQKQWAIARGLALAFETKGARVLSARGAAAGLELAYDPYLVAGVLDSESPQLCRLLDKKQISYVVYSGRAQLDDACADATFIRKPASAEEVVASVERLLGSRDHAH
jgi:DNA-binding response OmpR family regulator